MPLREQSMSRMTTVPKESNHIQPEFVNKFDRLNDEFESDDD